MIDFTKLADYDMVGVAIALIIVIVYLIRFLKDREKCHDESYNKLRDSIDANTEVTKETYKYLKLRNGSIEKILQMKKGDKGDKGGV
jgi:uncharacterized protein YoxC